MKTQEEFLQEILALKAERPELEIHFCVDNEEICSDYSWTAHKITRIEVNPWFANDESILTDTDEILDALENQLFSGKTREEAEAISAEAADYMVNEMYDAQVKQAICVFTNAG